MSFQTNYIFRKMPCNKETFGQWEDEQMQKAVNEYVLSASLYSKLMSVLDHFVFCYLRKFTLTFRYKAQQLPTWPVGVPKLGTRELAIKYLNNKYKSTSLQRRINGEVEVMGRASGGKGRKRKDIQKRKGKLTSVFIDIIFLDNLINV